MIVTESFKNEIRKALPSLRKFARSQRSAYLKDVDDLIQDTLEYALRHPENYRANTDMAKWLVAICWNISRNMYRSAKVRQKYIVDDPDADVSELPPQLDRLMLLDTNEVIDRLPIDQKAALFLVCYDGKSYKEAAEILQLSVGTVKSRVSRARAEISANLNADNDSDNAPGMKLGL